MLPEPLTSLAGDVEQDLERVYAEWCLEVEHPDLEAFVEHLVQWRLVSEERGQAVLAEADPGSPVPADSPFTDAPPSETADDMPTVRDDGFGPEPTFETPAAPAVAGAPEYRRDDSGVEEFDLFDEADMATVHDAAWPGRPVDSDEVDIDALFEETPEPAPPTDPGEPAANPATPAGGRFDDPPPDPLTPFAVDPDDEPIGDLETVIKKTPPLGDLDTHLRPRPLDDGEDLRSMITAVPVDPKVDFEADTVQPAPEAGSPLSGEPTRATAEAWGAREGEADDTDTVTQAPPDMAADLLEGVLEEPSQGDDEPAVADDAPSASAAPPVDVPIAPVPINLAETRVPAVREGAAAGEATATPGAVHHLAAGASRAVAPVVDRLRAEPRLRVAAVVVAALVLIGMITSVVQVQAAFRAQAERERQAFVQAVTLGAVQASVVEGALVAGLGPLDATAGLVTDALENGDRWQTVVGRPPAEFRSENTLPGSGGHFDVSSAKTEGKHWVVRTVPAVITPEVEQQNPRWGAVSKVFAQQLPPMLNDRPAVGAVWVGLEDGFYITLPGRGVDDDHDPREDPVYRDARTASASVDWRANRYGLLTAARPLVSPETSEVLGVAAVEFDDDWVIDHLLPRRWSGVSDVGGVLLDDGAMIVAATTRDEARKIKPGVWESMVEADPTRTAGYLIERGPDGTDRLYLFHRLTSIGWTHVIYGPLARLTRGADPMVPGSGAPPGR